MSIPPSAPPPGGFYAAPPPANSNSGGCWKIAGIGCAVLLVLVIVVGVLAVRKFKETAAHPSKNNVFGIGLIAGKAGMDGARLRQAIVTYHAQHGKYPSSLMDLVRDGSIDGKLLHNDLDDSPDPGHVSWHYTRPAGDAPGSTPVLDEPYHISVGGNTAPGHIVISLDGRTRGDAASGQ